MRRVYEKEFYTEKLNVSVFLWDHLHFRHGTTKTEILTYLVGTLQLTFAELGNSWIILRLSTAFGLSKNLNI